MGLATSSIPETSTERRSPEAVTTTSRSSRTSPRTAIATTARSTGSSASAGAPGEASSSAGRTPVSACGSARSSAGSGLNQIGTPRRVASGSATAGSGTPAGRRCGRGGVEHRDRTGHPDGGGDHHADRTQPAPPAYDLRLAPRLARDVRHGLVGHPLPEQLAQSVVAHVVSSRSSASSGATARSRASAAWVWLFTVPTLTPIAAAVSRSVRSS